VVLLSDETKTKKLLEVQMKDLKAELDEIKDPERIQKLEDSMKRMRLVNDNLQQQFMLQVEKIGDQEKQLNKYRTEKLEYETKYEERIFFIERQSREKREKVKKEMTNEITELKKIRAKTERSHELMTEQLKDANAKLRMYGAGVSGPEQPELSRPALSTGPSPPPRKGTRKSMMIPSSDIKESRLPVSPLLPLGFKVPGSSPSGISPILAPHIANQTSEGKGSSAHAIVRMPYDVWEGGNRVVLAVDVPGVEMELIDVYITRFTVTVSRKVGVFESKNLVNKYKPLHLLRFTRDQISQILTDEIALPCAVQPDRKIAYHHHGTVYLTIEKMETTVSNIRISDWVQTAQLF